MEYRVAVAQSLRGLTSLADALIADTKHALSGLAAAPRDAASLAQPEGQAQFWFRMLLRAFFAEVEGISFAMRRSLLNLASHGHVALSPGEIAVLSELRYRLANGRLQEIEAFNKPLDNVVFSFSLFARSFGTDFALNISDNAWSCFRRSLRKRDAVTHPRSRRDLLLSLADVDDLQDGAVWFAQQFHDLMAASVTAIKQDPRFNSSNAPA
jgi:hypothetical protein